MSISKNLLNNYIKLWMVTIFSLSILYFTDNIYIHILSILTISLVAIHQSDYDITHPYFWFTTFFLIYSISYPILYLMGYRSNIVYNKIIIYYQIIALVTALTVIGSSTNKNSVQDIKFNNTNIDIGIINKIIYVFMGISLILVSIYISKYGYSGKDEIYRSNKFFLQVILRIPLVLTMLYILTSFSIFIKVKKISFHLTFLTFIVLLLITLFSGERDFIFRFILSFIFILWITKTITLKHLVLILPIIILIFPLTTVYKYYFLSGVKYEINENILFSLISGEFESSSRNLQVLINHDYIMLGSKGVKQICYDIISVFNSSINSTTMRFNNYFYPHSRVQYGFSLVGEGYLIGGTIGIILIFSIVAFIIKYMYRNCFNSIYMLSAYVYFCTVVIYSFRADLSYILSSLFKQIIVILLLFYTINSIEYRRSKI